MKRISTLLLLIFLASSLGAQNKDDRQKRWEEMVAKRAAFFTERINLTPQEAEKFWPVYNQLEEKKHKLNDRMRLLHQNVKKNDKGEKILDYEKATDDMIYIKVQEAALEKSYHEKFKKILSPEKLFRFYLAERDWGEELLKQIQKRGDPKQKPQ